MDSSVHKRSFMERSRDSLYRLALFAFVAMAVTVGCAAETSPDPTPGNEANLNPQPLPPLTGDGDNKTGDQSGSEVDDGANASSCSSGSSGSSGSSSGNASSSSSSSGSPDAGRE